MGQRSVNSPPDYMDNKTHTILVGIWHAQEINNQNKDAYLRFLVVRCEKDLVNEHKHTIYANPKFTKIYSHDQTKYMLPLVSTQWPPKCNHEA